MTVAHFKATLKFMGPLAWWRSAFCDCNSLVSNVKYDTCNAVKVCSYNKYVLVFVLVNINWICTRTSYLLQQRFGNGL